LWSNFFSKEICMHTWRNLKLWRKDTIWTRVKSACFITFIRLYFGATYLKRMYQIKLVHEKLEQGHIYQRRTITETYKGRKEIFSCSTRHLESSLGSSVKNCESLAEHMRCCLLRSRFGIFSLASASITLS
jgi:hypothetical protein